MNFKFPQFVATPLAQLIPNASGEAIDLMTEVSIPSLVLAHGGTHASLHTRLSARKAFSTRSPPTGRTQVRRDPHPNPYS